MAYNPQPDLITQFVVIGPVPRDLKALATAFATLDTTPAPTNEDNGVTTSRMPMTNVKIYSRPNGSRLVEVVASTGREELHVSRPRLPLAR